jgi:N-carbamoyl-L-amino-acid hydrolase
MVSGALHDPVSTSRVLPNAMIFVPSIGDKSHCFKEDSRSGELVRSCAVLAAAVEKILSQSR